jgi:large subunit ribosomal protein L13
LTWQGFASIMVNGIVCPTRAPETQVFVKHSKSKLEEKNVRTTYMAKPGEVDRKWYVVDATDVPLGRLSTVVASMLRGKNKPTFTPHIDTGDFVIVINADKVKLTGKKATDKIYYRHSNFPGGLKSISAGEMRAKNSRRLIETSVKGMLPKNTLGRAQGMKLHVYGGAEHPHAAQQPEVLDITNLI